MTLHLDTQNVLRCTVESLIGQRIAVLGISGSGKTNTGAVLAEELLPHIAMTICDIEGEYFGLKQRFDLLIAGRSEHAEVPLLVENAAAIAEMSIRRGISVILDLSEYDADEMQPVLMAYFESLWKWSTALKSPYEIIVEEAHEFVPQSQRAPLKTLLTRFALRGRKRGVGVVLASQRSAKVEKDLLTQTNVLILHNAVHPVDLSVYKDLVPLPAKDVEQQARELAPGEAFVVRGKNVERVHIRQRSTYHAGATPQLGEAQPSLKAINADLLEELRAITERSAKEGGSDEVSRLRRQLRDAEAKIAVQQAQIEELQRQLAMASLLRVEMHAPLPTPQMAQSPAQTERPQPASAPASPSTQHIALSDFERLRYEEFKRGLRSLVRNSARAKLAYSVLCCIAQTGGEMARADVLLALQEGDRRIRESNIEGLLENKRLIAVARRGTAHAIYYRSLLPDRLKALLPGRSQRELQQLSATLFD